MESILPYLSNIQSEIDKCFKDLENYNYKTDPAIREYLENRLSLYIQNEEIVVNFLTESIQPVVSK